MRAHTIIFFLFLSVLLLSPAYADSIPTTHFSDKIHVKALQVGVPWDITMWMDVTVRDYVCMNGAYNSMYAQFSVGNIPTYVWKGGTPGYILKTASAEIKVAGTHVYTVASDSKSKPNDGWGDVGSIGLQSNKILVKENRDGVYFWDLHVHLYYEHLVGGVVTDTYTINYDLIPKFNDFTIVSFSTGGDWGSQLEQGVTKAFSQIWNVWTVTAQKITDLNWNIAFNLNPLGFDLLKFVENLELLAAFIGFALFKTFQAPITTISMIMAHLNNTMVLSFFVISLVIVVLIAITLLVVIWKIIMLVKP